MERTYAKGMSKPLVSDEERTKAVKSVFRGGHPHMVDDEEVNAKVENAALRDIQEYDHDDELVNMKCTSCKEWFDFEPGVKRVQCPFCETWMTVRDSVHPANAVYEPGFKVKVMSDPDEKTVE